MDKRFMESEQVLQIDSKPKDEVNEFYAKTKFWRCYNAII